MNRPSTSSTITVLVPTLNEEERLGQLLENLAVMDPPPGEVIICDAGSSDQTCPLAEAQGALVVQAPRGRGCQIAAGLPHAKGDILFFAHADMKLEPDLFSRIHQALEKSDAPGGAVGCRFDTPSLFLKGITFLNTLRARVGGISFGDQGQFIRKDRLEEIGGYPNMVIMEDVEFSFRLKKAGRPLFLGGGVLASSRRWQESKKGLHALLIIRLVAHYSLVRWLKGPPVDVAPFYERYYGKPLG